MLGNLSRYDLYSETGVVVTAAASQKLKNVRKKTKQKQLDKCAMFLLVIKKTKKTH